MTYNRKYIGARYVPKFADPIDWNDDYSYEPLMIVMHEGDTYTSAQFVPAGIAITNTDYWVKTADYNAQIAQFADDLDAFVLQLGSIDDDVTALENKFPVSISDGGTGSTSYANNSIIMTNADSSAFVAASSDDIVDAISNEPVNRAIADEEGNNIIDTYATKNDVLGLEIITQYSEIFDTTAFANCNITDISKFKFIRFGKICVVSAYYTLKQDVLNNTVFQFFGAFKKYIPVATLPNMGVAEYAHCSYDDIDGRQYTSVNDATSVKWLGFECKGYESNDLPGANDAIYIELMYICE